VVLLLAVVAMAALSLVAVGVFSKRVLDRGRAHTAADAAALAATTGGRAAAERLANSNGGHLILYRQDGDLVVVVVEVDGQRATAKATDGP
jgi:outer membrane lipoprotein SlyB